MDSTQWAILEAIRATPEDDLPRLVYADWLEEHGEDERAEFIRVQCRHPDLTEGERVHLIALGHTKKKSWFGIPEDWEFKVLGVSLHGSMPGAVVSRGFVHSVSVPTLEMWRGGECPTCVRIGMRGDAYDICYNCSASGYVPGIGRELCRWNPVQEVRVGDKRPLHKRQWWNGDREWEHLYDPESDMPGPIFEIMERLGGYKFSTLGQWLSYKTEADANHYWSQALILEQLESIRGEHVHHV